MDEQIQNTGMPFNSPALNSTPVKEEPFPSSSSEMNISEWSETLSQLDTRLSATEQKLSEVNTAATNLKKTVAEQKNEYSELKQKIIEGLGLFVAFITFVSANVTVFSKVEHVSIAILFMGLMLLCMLCFLYAFFLVVDSKSKTLKEKMLPFIWKVAFAVGMIFLALWLIEKQFITIVHNLGREKSICINCVVDENGKIYKPHPILKTFSSTNLK